MSISSIFTELDLIQTNSTGSQALLQKQHEPQQDNAQPYVSAASILLEEKKNAKNKEPAHVTLLSSSRQAASRSLDQIAVSSVNAPTYWKSNNGSANKKKSKAVKSGTTLSSKKLRMKHEKAENYVSKQQTKHSKKNKLK
jgi:hypothetical protein